VSSSNDGTLRVWSLQKHTLMHTLAGHENPVRCFRAIGQVVASGAADGVVKVWNSETGELINTYNEHKEEVSDIALLENGELFTASYDKSIRCFDLESGKSTGRLMGHQDLIKCIRAQPTESGSRIISGGWDGLIKIWDRPRKVKRKKKIKVRACVRASENGLVLKMDSPGLRVMYDHRISSSGRRDYDSEPKVGRSRGFVFVAHAHPSTRDNATYIRLIDGGWFAPSWLVILVVIG